MRRAALILVVAAACGDGTDKTDACHFGQMQSAATVQDRKVIGGVAPYDADLSLAQRDDELRTSIAARRANQRPRRRSYSSWVTASNATKPPPMTTTFRPRFIR